MVTTVKPRQLPGLAILGLLASLIAHAASYGGNHELGGAYHATLELLALVGAGAFAASIGAFAWLGARRYAEGSILAAALRPLVPSPGALAVSAGLWFGLIESLEPEHPLARLPSGRRCLPDSGQLAGRVRGPRAGARRCRDRPCDRAPTVCAPAGLLPAPLRPPLLCAPRRFRLPALRPAAAGPDATPRLASLHFQRSTHVSMDRGARGRVCSSFQRFRRWPLEPESCTVSSPNPARRQAARPLR